MSPKPPIPFPFPFLSRLPLLLTFILTSSLPILLTQTRAESITLHPTHGNTTPPLTKLSLPHSTPVRLTLSIPLLHANEIITSLQHTLPKPSTLTLTAPLPHAHPHPHKTNRTLSSRLSIPLVGGVTFTITVVTTNPFHVYVAYMRVLLPGVVLRLHDQDGHGHGHGDRVGDGDLAVPPAGVVRIGAYKDWIRVQQIGVPVTVRGLPDAVGGSDGGVVRVKVLSGNAVDSDVCAVTFGGTGNTRIVTLHPHGHSEGYEEGRVIRAATTLRGVRFPPGCGVSLTRGYLLLRLNPYRVSAYKISVNLTLTALTTRTLSPSTTTLEFLYDPLVPPVVFTAPRVVLDPSGGELLEFAAENMLTPPRKRRLQKGQVTLRLLARGTPIASLTPVSMRPMPGHPRIRVLAFRTGVLRTSAQTLQPRLYAAGRRAVADPMHPVRISLASPRLARLDACARPGNGTAFVSVVLRVPYNSTTFTHWKSRLIKHALQPFFPTAHLRLVDIADRRVTYAVLHPEKVPHDALYARVELLLQALRNRSFARAVHVWREDIAAHSVKQVNTSVCKAFPHLLSTTSARDIRGRRVSLLPLWTSFPTALLFVVTVMFAQTATADRVISATSYSWTTSISDAPATHELDKSHDNTGARDAAYIPVCSYPSEARAEFARRYDVRDTITSENVRDSDLASSDEEEREKDMRKMAAVVRVFGHGFKGLGAIWKKLRGYELQGVDVSPTTGSTNESPTIYIERLSHDYTFTTTAYC